MTLSGRGHIWRVTEEVGISSFLRSDEKCEQTKRTTNERTPRRATRCLLARVPQPRARRRQRRSRGDNPRERGVDVGRGRAVVARRRRRQGPPSWPSSRLERGRREDPASRDNDSVALLRRLPEPAPCGSATRRARRRCEPTSLKSPRQPPASNCSLSRFLAHIFLCAFLAFPLPRTGICFRACGLPSLPVAGSSGTRRRR